MPYQNTGLAHTASTVLGSAVLYYGATAGAATTNLGLARDIVVTENWTRTTSQADNGPDPINAVTRQTVTVSFSLLEFYPPAWDALRGVYFGTASTATGTYVAGTAYIYSAGGMNELDNVALKLINNTLVAGATTQTAIVVKKANIMEGLNLAFPSDNADDPILPVPFTFEGKVDTSQALGTQLMTIECELNA